MPENKEKPILVPELTGELLEENAQNQKLWAKQLSLPKMTPKNYWEAVVNSNLEILETLHKQYRKANNFDEGNAITQKINRFRDEAADAYAQIGRFFEASEMAFDERRKRLFNKYLLAEVISEKEDCDCPNWERAGENINQNRYREFSFETNGEKRFMLRCRKCGFRNTVTTLPSDLQNLSNQRAKIVSLTQNLRKEDARRVVDQVAEKDVQKIIG